MTEFRKGQNQYLIVLLEEKVFTIKMCRKKNCVSNSNLIVYCVFYLILIFQAAIVPFLQQVFMPLVSTIFQVLSTPSDDLDQVTAVEKKMLQRSYYLFLSTIISNDCLDVIKNQGTEILMYSVHVSVG